MELWVVTFLAIAALVGTALISSIIFPDRKD